MLSNSLEMVSVSVRQPVSRLARLTKSHHESRKAAKTRAELGPATSLAEFQWRPGACPNLKENKR